MSCNSCVLFFGCRELEFDRNPTFTFLYFVQLAYTMYCTVVLLRWTDRTHVRTSTARVIRILKRWTMTCSVAGPPLQVKHPFIISLQYAFQNDTSLFLVLEFISGGDLYHHMDLKGTFTEEEACFISSELILALGYLHQRDIAFRDLKAENILLDEKGHGAPRLLTQEEEEGGKAVDSRAEYSGRKTGSRRGRHTDSGAMASAASIVLRGGPAHAASRRPVVCRHNSPLDRLRPGQA